MPGRTECLRVAGRARIDTDPALLADLAVHGKTPRSAIVVAVDEVFLAVPDTVAPGTAINIQDGTYGGGGPATVEGDTVGLPATGALFKGAGRYLCVLN